MAGKKSNLEDEDDYMQGDFGTPSDEDHDIGLKKLIEREGLPSPEEMIAIAKRKRNVLVTFIVNFIEEEMYEDIPVELEEGYQTPELMEAIVIKFPNFKDKQHLIKITKTQEKR